MKVRHKGARSIQGSVLRSASSPESKILRRTGTAAFGALLETLAFMCSQQH